MGGKKDRREKSSWMGAEFLLQRRKGGFKKKGRLGANNLRNGMEDGGPRDRVPGKEVGLHVCSKEKNVLKAKKRG